MLLLLCSQGISLTPLHTLLRALNLKKMKAINSPDVFSSKMCCTQDLLFSGPSVVLKKGQCIHKPSLSLNII